MPDAPTPQLTCSDKTFEFTQHDPSELAQWWFQHDPQGLVLFVVFYTQSCRWNRCFGCNLPTRSSSRPVGFGNIMAQVDQLFAIPDVQARAGEIRKVIVSNNGSVLDEITFPTTALFYLLARMNERLLRMSTLSLETRPEYVDLDELAYLSRALGERECRCQLEIGVGFEAFDDRIRNQVFHKGLRLEEFEKLARLMAPYGFALKCYFMHKPVPGMSDQEAIEDICHAIDYLHDLATKYSISVNMHLNPTYVAFGTPLAKAFAAGLYTPPHLADVARAARQARGKAVSIYLGLFDEGLAVPGGSFIRPDDKELVGHLEEFNRTGDYDLLDRI